VYLVAYYLPLYLHNARTSLGDLPNAVNYLNILDNIVFYSAGIAMETRNVQMTFSIMDCYATHLYSYFLREHILFRSGRIWVN